MADSTVKKYYDGLAQGKLLGKKCNKCGGVTFPPTTACNECGSYEQDWTELSGRGRLLFLSHGIAPPPNPRFNDLAPYGYGHVKLEEGVYVQAIITGVDISPDALRKHFEAGPSPVIPDILDVEGLPVLAFKAG
ncbi:MAG: OB-fold domain-containing protein [Deltaproteobacteria bacterium]|nr:OB-fold domain-containing protein [Deltaproteobacteria bacterium]